MLKDLPARTWFPLIPLALLAASGSPPPAAAQSPSGAQLGKPLAPAPVIPPPAPPSGAQGVKPVLPAAAGPQASVSRTPSYAQDAQPLLKKYCYDCHGEGSSRGDVALDGHPTEAARRGDVKLWSAVAENLRADLMPPAGKPRPTVAERNRLIDWIRADVQHVDCRAPDPGRVTLRRLNRTEYTNTVRDLFDLKIDPSEFFPPDDSGYGFDNIGDVLTVSPVLMEKYFDAAERVARALIAEKPAVPEQRRVANDFKLVDEPAPGRSASEMRLEVPKDGKYDLQFKVNVRSFDPFTGKARLKLLVDDHRGLQQAFASGNKGYPFTRRVTLTAGEHVYRIEVDTSDTKLTRQRPITINVDDFIVRGPAGTLDYPEPHKRIFFQGPAPRDPEQRFAYARELLRRVADRAYRRPVEETTLDRLAEIVRTGDKGRPGDFERGVRQGMVAILTSPRFLFRPELRPGPAEVGETAVTTAPLDDWSLAVRLSYLLWSTGPDDDLRAAAQAGTLHDQLRPTVARMLADDRAERFVTNFVGQWLHTRDVDSIPVSSELARRLSEGVRKAMRSETEMLFAHIMREDRDLLELLTADYTFANQALAKFYGMTEEVKGPSMRKVDLAPGSMRGGILSHGSFLLVTSNPTRTSPVKRGLFVLENLLGTPPPPPPPNIPALEEASAGKGELSIRDQLALHRANPACANCHARMDPIGLGLESFDATGAQREDEKGKPIDASGTLITGEAFKGVRELRAILAKRREAFYRTVTRKLMTYALGRGLDPPDECTVDGIVGRLLSDGGRFSTLLLGIIDSRPFQLQSTTEEGS